MRSRALLLVVPLLLGVGLLRWVSIVNFTVEQLIAEQMRRDPSFRAIPPAPPYPEETIRFLLSDMNFNRLVNSSQCREPICSWTCPWDATSLRLDDEWMVMTIGPPRRNLQGFMMREYTPVGDKPTRPLDLSSAPFRWSATIGHGSSMCPLIDWRYSSGAAPSIVSQNPCHAPEFADLLWIEAIDGPIASYL